MSIDSDRVDRPRLAARAARAVAWSYASWSASRILSLAVTAVLARLLVPEDFGLVGFATVVVVSLTVVQDLGFGSALIQRRDRIEEAADTAFTVGMLTGTVLALGTALGAPAVAAWFDAPAVTSMLRVLGLSFVIAAAGHTHVTLLRRSLSFRRRAVPEVGGTVVRGVVAVGAALAGAGPWALIAGQLAGVTASTVLAWMVEPWRPSLRVPLMRPMARFGFPLLGADTVHALVANLDYVIVGKVLGPAALGTYTLAYRLPELLLMGVVAVLNRAVFPALAEVQDRIDALRSGFLATMHYVPMAVVPIGIGLMVAAEPIVLVILGADWVEAVPVLRVLAAYAMVSTLMVADGDVYKATGRSGLLARFAALKLVLLLPALLIAVHHGLVAVAVAHLGTTMAVKIVRVAAAARILEVRVGDLLKPLLPTLVAGTALTVVAIGVLAATAGLGAPARLLTTAAAGAAAYLAVLLRLEWQSIKRLWDLLQRNG